MARIICLVFACLIFSTPALAEDLTRTEVRNFLEALKQMKAEGQDLDAQMNARSAENPPDPERPFTRVVEIIREVGFSEADGIVNSRGFTSLDDWGSTGDQIMAGVRAAVMRQNMPAMNAQIEQMLLMLEQNPNVTDAQRAEIMQQIETAKKLSGPATLPPTADELLVGEMQTEINAAFK